MKTRCCLCNSFRAMDCRARSAGFERHTWAEHEGKEDGAKRRSRCVGQLGHVLRCREAAACCNWARGIALLCLPSHHLVLVLPRSFSQLSLRATLLDTGSSKALRPLFFAVLIVLACTGSVFFTRNSAHQIPWTPPSFPFLVHHLPTSCEIREAHRPLSALVHLPQGSYLNFARHYRMVALRTMSILLSRPPSWDKATNGSFVSSKY